MKKVTVESSVDATDTTNASNEKGAVFNNIHISTV